MLVKIYTENPSEKEIDRVVNLLERDGVVIYPTDSVYAFGCSIRSAKAVERLRRIMGRISRRFPSCSIRSGGLPIIAGWITLSSGC